MARELLIQHQSLPPGAAEAIAARLPPGIRFLPVERLWQLDPAAEVLIAAPAHGGSETAPPRPATWPGRLRWLHLRVTGIDDFPDWIGEVGLFTGSRGAQSVAIAEYVLAALLAQEKRLAEIFIRDAGDWRAHALGTLEGRTLGLLGFGTIGRAVAVRALAFGMRVLAHRRSAASPHLDGVVATDLATVLAQSDHLVLALPLTAASRALLDAAAFARMKPGAHLVNVSRGAVIDQEALRAALDGERLAAATLDVWDPEPPPPGHWVYTHPKVRLSPHVSYSAPTTSPRATETFIANLHRFLAGDHDAMTGKIDRQARY